MSPDWSAKAEPVPYAKLGDPQTLNLYAYVGNNPLRRADAEGGWPIQRVFRWVGAVAVAVVLAVAPARG